MKQIILTMLLVIALSLAATGCITYNETSDPADPEVVYVTQTPEIVYVTQTPEPTPTPTLIPTLTPTPTSTKVVPTIFPTPTPTPSPAPTPSPTAISCGLRLDVYLDTLSWNDNQIALVRCIKCDHHTWEINPSIECALIYVGDELVATIVPVVVQWNPERTRRIIETPMLINLPPGVDVKDGVTMKVSISGSPNIPDGIYPNPITVRTPPDRYAEEYSKFPVYNP